MAVLDYLEHVAVGSIFAGVTLGVGYLTNNFIGALPAATAAFMLGFQNTYTLKQIIVEVEDIVATYIGSPNPVQTQNHTATAKPSSANVSQVPSVPTYKIANQTISADVFSPLGQVDTFGSIQVVVGMPIPNSMIITGSNGATTVPSGAVYVGKGVFFSSALAQYYDTA